MATYNELEQRIKELKSRTGKGSISPRETFDLMDELLSKTKGVDMTAQPLVVVRSYNTLALANTDKNPVNPATNKPMAVGQLMSVVADGANNAVYRLASLAADGAPTWEKQAELGDMAAYAKQTDLVQLAGDVNNKILNIKPINLWNWGKLDAMLGLNETFKNYTKNSVGAIDIIGTWYQYLEIPEQYRGKRMYFGVKCLPNGLREMTYFLKSGTIISGTLGTYTKVGELDADGYQAYSITHPNQSDIVPSDATHIGIQLREYPVGSLCGLKELYMGELPYTGDTNYKEHQTIVYPSYSSNLFIDSSIGKKGNIEISDNNFSVTPDGINNAIELYLRTPTRSEVIGKNVNVNVKIQSDKAIEVLIYKYNSIGINIGSTAIGCILNGEITKSFDLSDASYARILLKCSTSATFIGEVKFGNSTFDFRNSDIPVSNDKLNALVENDKNFDTLNDFITSGKYTGLVAGQSWYKLNENVISDMNAEINAGFPNFGNGDFRHNRLPSSLSNIQIVDTKGIHTGNTTGFNGFRLLFIDNQDYMWFFNSTNRIHKIKVDDFLNNLLTHDGSGTDASRLMIMSIPEATQTLADKQNYLTSALPKWKMWDETKTATLFPEVIADTRINIRSIEFENGSRLIHRMILRADGSKGTPVLNKPILCNPTHIRLWQNGSIVQTIPLRTATNSNRAQWGYMLANQGALTFVEEIYAMLDFFNGKNLNVAGFNIPVGEYELELVCRRWGTHTIDSGNVKMNTAIGVFNIPITGAISTIASESAALTSFRIPFSVSTALTQFTLIAECADSKEWTMGNGAASYPYWGFQARGKYGISTEYVPQPSRAGFLYFTKDNGETWDALFDMSIPEVFTNTGGQHIHGAFIDPYANKLIILNGDYNDPKKGLIHSDFSDDITRSTTNWKLAVGEMPFYESVNREQYINGYALPEGYVLCTDVALDAVCFMPRKDMSYFTKREKTYVIDTSSEVTHTGAGFFRKDENSPLFIPFFNASSANSRHRAPMLFTTFDGRRVKKIWEDEVGQSPFGNNVYLTILHHKDKVFMQIYGDGRFNNGNTLIISDYSV